ncbi:MAG: PAC2 family protein [Chloroflexota bacterium]
MADSFKVYARPRLFSPNMLACWPGIGNVSLIIGEYLLKKLEFKDLGEIEPAYFFDPIGVMVQDNVVEAPRFPQNQFYYWKNRKGKSDLILFMGEAQPPIKGYELANHVLDFGLKYRIRRVYTCAAAVTRIHHTEQPRVWGVATQPGITRELARFDLVQKGSLQIAGLNGLLLGVAKERIVEGVCLLGEVPTYATRVPSPQAALAVSGVLAALLDIGLDTRELAQEAAEMKARLKQVAAEAMGEYIDYFTEPIWERGQEESEEGGEEENGEEGYGTG